jgi:hypothetical protein
MKIFDTLVKEFKKSKNKRILIQIMTEFCKTASNEQVYKLRKNMELYFSKAVDCVYCYSTTPNDYGCDLREIFYDRQNNLIDGGKELLDIFEKKKLTDRWHIMTDMDNTLYPSKNHKGNTSSDISWKQKEPYPGITLFYREFYKSLSEESRYSTILSAAPGCFKATNSTDANLTDSKHKLYTIVKEYGFIQGVENKKVIDKYVKELPKLFKLYGNTKFERFKQYTSLFPEYKILFIGDNGQGDIVAGEQMLNHCDRCKVFIHKISEDGKQYKNVASTSDIYFFENYHTLSEEFERIGIFNPSVPILIKEAIQKQLVLYPSFTPLYTKYKKRTKRKIKNKFTRKR